MQGVIPLLAANDEWKILNKLGWGAGVQPVIPLLRLHGTPNCWSKSLKRKDVAVLAKFKTTTLSKQGAASRVCPYHSTRMHCVRVARFIIPIGLFRCIRVPRQRGWNPSHIQMSTSPTVPPASPRSATVNACRVSRFWAISTIPKQATKTGRQTRPSKQAATTGRQNSPPKQATKTGHQNRPPKQPTTSPLATR